MPRSGHINFAVKLHGSYESLPRMAHSLHKFKNCYDKTVIIIIGITEWLCDLYIWVVAA